MKINEEEAKIILENLEEDTQKWIKAVLINDENSTDEELITYFQQEGGLTKHESEMIVLLRIDYLGE